MADRSGLAPIDVGWRESAAQRAFADLGVDALIVTSPTNIRWLTGFAGSNATVVITGSSMVLFTDDRYAERAPAELASVASTAQVAIARDLSGPVGELLGGASEVALEADHVSWALQQSIDDRWVPDAELVPTIALLDELRSTKDAAEIERIEFAAGVVDRALASTVGLLRERPTERGFAAALEAAIRAGGADDIGFDTIVASGPNGAIPHHSPADRVVETGDLVIVDVGGRVDGYRSDMTRTFCVGTLTTGQARHYDTVIEAQQAGVDAMRVGEATRSVDAAARAVIERAGWGDAFSHGTGHGIGLDIHELPRVSKAASEVYTEGTVATVEPGVYLSGVAGVRIEDTCVATAEGARRLTGFAKDPEI